MNEREKYDWVIESEETDIIEENDALADTNAFMDWLFNERRGDALKLYAQYARTITKEG